MFAWDLRNCLDPAAGPDKLCLRAHNAMDPNVYCKDSEKIVYGVHLEQAVMIQVQQKQKQPNVHHKLMQAAGSTGRVVVSDFWDFDTYDTYQLESYVHDQPAQS